MVKLPVHLVTIDSWFSILLFVSQQRENCACAQGNNESDVTDCGCTSSGAELEAPAIDVQVPDPPQKIWRSYVLKIQSTVHPCPDK